jgi:hypothetical protein
MAFVHLRRSVDQKDNVFAFSDLMMREIIVGVAGVALAIDSQRHRAVRDCRDERLLTNNVEDLR